MFLTVSCFVFVTFFFFKQKTAYEMRISDWSSDVCSSDLLVFDEGAWMNRLIRLIAICFGSLILWTSPLQAQERSAVRAGFELPANSGKKILIFRPRISVGSQSTGGMFEPNAEWTRSEEHTSELQSLMRISYAVLCLKKKKR